MYIQIIRIFNISQQQKFSTDDRFDGWNFYIKLVSQSITFQEKKMGELTFGTNNQILWIKKNKIMLY